MATAAYDETIIDAVVTALEGIAVQSGDNYTIAKVYRLNRDEGDDGKRPSARLQWLGTALFNEGSELRSDLRLRIEAQLDYDPNSPKSSDEQNLLLAHDVVKAITNIDYATNDAYLRSLDCVPNTSEDTEETTEGVVIDCVFAFAVDFKSPQTATAPLS